MVSFLISILSLRLLEDLLILILVILSVKKLDLYVS